MTLVLAIATAACARVASPRGWASPVQGDGVLLVAHRDELFALDPVTLVARQIFPPDPNPDDIDPVALYGTPAVSDGRIFIPTHDDKLYALDLEGAPVWLTPFEAGDRLIGGAIVVDEIVYFGSEDGNVYALDAGSGFAAWTGAGGVEQWFETGDGVWSTPALFDGTLYVTSLDGSLYALDAATGQLQWSFKTAAGIASTPVVNEAERLVYVGGFDSKLRAIDIDTRDERWSITADNWFWTTPLLAGGVLYAGSLDAEVYAVDAATGVPVWDAPFPTQGPIRGAPVLAGGVLLVADRDGNVYGVDPATGSDAFAGPLILEDDVFADPLLRVVEQDGETFETVLVMTTGGDLVEIDPETLRAVDTVPLGD